jgi:hypothetical protein
MSETNEHCISFEGNVINLSGRFTPESFFYFKLYEIMIHIHEMNNNGILKKFKITFEGCDFLCPNAMVILGVIDKWSKIKGIDLYFDFTNLTNYEVLTFILNSGFASYVNGNKSKYDNIKSSKYFKWFDISNENTGEIIDFIKDVVQLIPVRMSDELEADLISKFYEIIINSYHHSKSMVGIFSCAYYFEESNVLHFAIYDCGEGIPNNVSNYLSEKISAVDALKWAFTDGNTTKKSDYPRGLGLGLLKSFVKANDGE